MPVTHDTIITIEIYLKTLSFSVLRNPCYAFPPLKVACCDVLSGQTLASPPIWLMRQAGRYLPEYRKVRSEVGSFLDLCRDPVLAAEVTLQPLRRFDLDAAIVFSDILIVPYALGQTVEFLEGEGPRLDPVRNETDLSLLDPAAASELLCAGL